PARLAPLRRDAPPRAPRRGSRHDRRRAPRREHRGDGPLSARLPTFVLPRAVRLLRRPLSRGRDRRGAPGDAAALSGHDRQRPERRAARARQSAHPLRSMNLRIGSEILFALGRRYPRLPVAFLRAMPLPVLRALRAPAFRETLRAAARAGLAAPAA